jgi:hypothetical protein
VNQLSAPARLPTAGQVPAPSVVSGKPGSLTARFRVTACGGRPVQGAMLFETAVPCNQFTRFGKPWSRCPQSASSEEQARIQCNVPLEGRPRSSGWAASGERRARPSGRRT